MPYLKVPAGATQIGLHNQTFEAVAGLIDISTAALYVVKDLIALAGCKQVSDDEAVKTIAAAKQGETKQDDDPPPKDPKVTKKP
jgi:hypothetical protein